MHLGAFTFRPRNFSRSRDSFFAQIRELYEVHMMKKSILMIFLLVLSMLINK